MEGEREGKGEREGGGGEEGRREGERGIHTHTGTETDTEKDRSRQRRRDRDRHRQRVLVGGGGVGGKRQGHREEKDTAPLSIHNRARGVPPCTSIAKKLFH